MGGNAGSGGNAGTNEGGRGGGGGGGAGGMAGGGGTIVVDAGVDAGGGKDIRCGNTFCTAMSEFCCIPENGTARCVTLSTVNTCPDSAAKVRCDDRSDCPLATQICCAMPPAMGNGATATCRTQVNCGPGRTELLCDPSDPSPCGPGGGTNVCRTDNQTIIPGYPSCH
jgi:hypothetical protein